MVAGFEDSAARFLDTIHTKRVRLQLSWDTLTDEERVLQSAAIDQDLTTYSLLLEAMGVYKSILGDVEANTRMASMFG